MTPGQKRRARNRRIRKRQSLRLARVRKMDSDPEAYCECGFCNATLLFNADLSYEVLGIAHDAGSPRMCATCMNQMEKPVEKWERQKWMNAYEMASIWNAVRQGRKIKQDIRDAIVGLMERTVDKLSALHERRQASPELIDGVYYRNAGQAYAYIGKLIALIAMWEDCANDPETRAWLKKTPFIVKRPVPLRGPQKKAKANSGRRNAQTTEIQRARQDDWEVLKSDGGWVGKRRRPREVGGCADSHHYDRSGSQTDRVRG